MIDVRQDADMVPPTGGDPFLKTAYFLKPISSIDDEPCLEIAYCCSKMWPEVKIRGWQFNHKDLKTWVDHLAPLHQSTWKKAGIYEAIFNSMYSIKRKSDFLCGFAEKWCPETNTFVFSWGEATITLEDVMVLGGFSVLGDSVFSPLECTELKKIQEELEEVRAGFVNCRTGSWNKATTDLWMKKFMKSGSGVEHEAFLVFWLSRYVFHNALGAVNKAVFPIAIRLARGVRVALAPAVLANIYRDLSELNGAIVANEMSVTLKSPLCLVQVWAWERFLEIRPRPNAFRYGEPRLARWDKVSALNVKHFRRVLDSAGEGFLWRPYAIAIENWGVPKYYAETEMWVLVGPDLDHELLSFAMCLRVGELVAFGTPEKYLPHRVAMQFGFDQDIPCSVAPSNQNVHVLFGRKLYIPSRLSEGDVSTRYFKWWKESVAGLEQKNSPQKKKAKRLEEEETSHLNDATIPCVHPPWDSENVMQLSRGIDEDNDSFVTPGFAHKLNSENLVQLSTGTYEDDDSDFPPGFAHKWNWTEAGQPMDEDHLTISDALKNGKKHENVETRTSSDSEKLSAHDQTLASSIADESSVNATQSEKLEKEAASSKEKQKNEMGRKARSPNNDLISLIANECSYSKQVCTSSSPLSEKRDCASSSPLLEKPGSVSSSSLYENLVSDVISMVSLLENKVEAFKAKTFGNNFWKIN